VTKQFVAPADCARVVLPLLTEHESSVVPGADLAVQFEYGDKAVSTIRYRPLALMSVVMVFGTHGVMPASTHFSISGPLKHPLGKDMTISILLADVLAAKADALLVTMDGARPGMEGNVARAFAKLWPDAYEEATDQLVYPVQLGSVRPTFTESECPFRSIIFASTLHHLDVLSDADKLQINASALHQAMLLASRHQLHSVATTVMTGGWRVPFPVALKMMLATVAYLHRKESCTDLLIHVRTAPEHELALQVASDCGLQL
jgi:hypothetical protein